MEKNDNFYFFKILVLFFINLALNTADPKHHNFTIKVAKLILKFHIKFTLNLQILA